ncbi:MAG TPA: cupredoxin family copper-binding protein [Acidimicrobiales bacterium]|nr:cupredoxin family copper-binding protein [Acidimicrobiales bacterium]
MLSTTSTRARRLLVLPFLALAMAACGGNGGGSSDAGQATQTTGADEASSASEVVIEGFAFNPMDIEVAPGTTVTWTNQDSAPHTVKDNGDLFPESEELAQGDTFEFTYDTPGEYPYICGIHQYMKGTVTVS